MTKRLFFLSLLVLSACTKTEQKTQLNLAIWSNYITPELIKNFEAKEKAQIVVSNFSSNEELLAKIQAGGTSYDVIIPSDYMISILIKEDRLLPLVSDKIPNRKSINQELLAKTYDPQNQYTLPYAWSTTGLVVNRDLFKGNLNSWNEFFTTPELNGKVSMLDDVREVLGAALKKQGYSLNSRSPKELESTKALLIKSRQRVRMFTSEPLNALQNKEIIAAQIYATDALQLIKKSPNFEYIIPSEGATMAIDNFAIPKTAKNSDLAHKFINYMLEAKSNEQMVLRIMAGPVLKTSLLSLSAEIQKNKALFPDSAVSKKLEMISDIGDQTSLYDRIWTEIKTTAE